MRWGLQAFDGPPRRLRERRARPCAGRWLSEAPPRDRDRAGFPGEPEALAPARPAPVLRWGLLAVLPGGFRVDLFAGLSDGWLAALPAGLPVALLSGLRDGLDDVPPRLF